MPARWATWAVAATVVAALPPAGDDDRQVALARLDDVVGQRDGLEGARRRARRAPTPSTTAMVAGTAPGAAHRLLDLAGDLQVVGPRQPVADDRRLERDHRAAPATLGDRHGATCRWTAHGTGVTA